LAIRLLENMSDLSPMPHFAQLFGPFPRHPRETQIPQHPLNGASTSPIAFDLAMQIAKFGPCTLRFPQSFGVAGSRVVLACRIIAISSAALGSIGQGAAKLQVQRCVCALEIIPCALG
jgi:hypothetical protein